jgi:hypothetical protein
LSSTWFEADFGKNLISYVIICAYVSGNGGRGQGNTLDVPKTQIVAEQQGVEQLGNIPPLHPIFEQLYKAQARPQPPTEEERKEAHSAYMRAWRKNNPEKHRQDVSRWERSPKGKAYKAAWRKEDRRHKKEAKMREQPSATSDPSVMLPAPENPTMAHARRTSGRKKLRV